MKTMLLTLLVLIALTTAVGAQKAKDTLLLRLTNDDIHDATLRDAGNGIYEIQTIGSDPYLFTEALPPGSDLPTDHVLAFEYFSTTGTGALQVFLDPPLDEAHSVSGEGLSHSEGWTAYAMDLKLALSTANDQIRRLRIDFGNAAGKTFQLRAIQLRPRTRQETRLDAQRAARREGEKQHDRRLRAYLDRKFTAQVAQVRVTANQIQVAGETGHASGALFLAEVPVSADITRMTTFPFVTPIQADKHGSFTQVLTRQAARGKDRLLSRWAVVRKTGDTTYELLSHARYADSVAARAELSPGKLRNKKGIGGFGLDRPLSDVAALNLTAATVNIALNGLIFTEPGEKRTAFSHNNETWYSDDNAVERLDKTLLAAAAHDLVVSAIILINQGSGAPEKSFSRRIAHPDADPAGIFVMPDLDRESGATAYAAALNFLAERYSRTDNRYGRIHHYILHNEINAAWIWTNAGEKTPLRYMDLYQKSLRMAHLIARQYDAHAQAFVSLEHHWSLPMQPDGRFYAGKDLLNLLAEYCRVEGDFDWALAFHPYPENLFDPRVWEDKQAMFSLDSPKITYKNLEVLDAWMRQPAMRFQQKRLRAVHLTEQGLNSPDYTEKSLRDQAAGMAYAWNKYKDLDSIQVFDYHNWVDNRGEGGLRIGLRRFPDDADDPLGKKPIWFVYQAIGTDHEADILDPYKAVVGVTNWSDVRHPGPIQ